MAAHQRAWYGLDLDPETDVLVTVGATEAIAATMLALCEPGDEVVMFEPMYDSYAASAAMAGAVPRPVRLHPPDWHFDPDELAAAVGPRTKLVLLNSPHNPTGKVFSPDELATGRRPVHEPRPPGGDRRGLRAPGLRRIARAAGHAARHGRAHADHLLGWQDVLLHGLEGGVGRAVRRRWWPPCGPPSSS